MIQNAASTAIAMELPATTKVGQPFTVKVRVTNPTRRAMKGLEVSLAEHRGFSFDEERAKVTVPEKPTAIDLAAKDFRFAMPVRIETFWT